MTVIMDSFAHVIKPFTDRWIKSAKQSGSIKVIETKLLKEVTPHLLSRGSLLATLITIAAVFASICPPVSVIAAVGAVGVALDIALLSKKAHSAYKHQGAGYGAAELFNRYKEMPVFEFCKKRHFA